MVLFLKRRCTKAVTVAFKVWLYRKIHRDRRSASSLQFVRRLVNCELMLVALCKLALMINDDVCEHNRYINSSRLNR